MEHRHIPVLLRETLHYLTPAPGDCFVDATYGDGGHARALLAATEPDGMVVALDADPEAVRHAGMLGRRIIAVQENFAQMAAVVRRVLPDAAVRGVLFDLGISSLQLGDASLGLSFQTSGPLDMRLSRSGSMTAATIVNSWSEADIADVIYRFGEERASRRIAKAIVAARRLQRISTTTQLSSIVERAIGRRGRIHPATKTFQALRMAVNGELTALEQGLTGALSIVARGGRIAVISFHSLEDRLVKTLFRTAARVCVCPPEAPRCTCERVAHWRVLTKKPVTPSRTEIRDNPRSRSAKLRVIEKIT